MNAVKLNEARAQLRERFGASLEEDLLEECAELCKNNNISGEDFWFKWEALTYNNRGTAPRVFDKGALQAIKEGIDREAAKVKAQRTQIKKNLGGLLSRNLGGIGRAGVGVKVAPSTSLKAQTLPVKVEGSAAGPSRVRVGRGQEPISRSYRYMYEKISDRSEALDDRIDEFAETIQKHYELPDLGDPSASTEEEVTVVGRITFDSDISSSEPVKLNEAVLALESSRAMGSGKRVPLRFDPKFKVQSTEGGVGLFPGAIVALKGRNGGGGSFVVSEVLALPPLQTDPPDLSGQAFTACIACGPFTSDADLEYAPWQAALKKIALENADVILLIGPFIDVTHTCFVDGNVDDTPISLFRKQFLSPLSDLLDSRPGATAILVPSIKDALSGHAVFPQNELSASLVEDTRIHLLPNPCHFTLNGVTFAASSVDVLFHLRKEEFFRIASEAHSNQGAAPQIDTMRRLCRHIVEQRSLYPIFPVPQDLSQEVNLDVSHSEALKLGGDLIDSKPLSILVLPSKLKHFTKVIGDTTVINSSYISKGTYSTIKFTPANIGQSIAECLITQIIRYD